MKKKIKIGNYVLIAHPYFGRLWLKVDQIDKKIVQGWVDGERILGHTLKEYMNFPITCIMKISK